MKRLSVRLSIVGAVLALGAAAIAHSMLSDKGEPPAGEEEPRSAAAETEEDGPPKPITVTSGTGSERSPAEDTLQPPPSSLFGGGTSTYQPVQHLTTDDDSTNSASAIPSTDPNASNGSFPVGVPPVAPGAGGQDEFPTAINDGAAGAFPMPTAGTPPPPNPAYGGSDGTAELPTAVAGDATSPGSISDTDPSQPNPANPSALTAPPADPSSAFPSSAPLTDTAPPSPPPAAGGLGAPVIGSNPADGTPADGSLAGDGAFDAQANPALPETGSNNTLDAAATLADGADVPLRPGAAALAGGAFGAAAGAALAAESNPTGAAPTTPVPTAPIPTGAYASGDAGGFPAANPNSAYPNSAYPNSANPSTTDPVNTRAAPPAGNYGAGATGAGTYGASAYGAGSTPAPNTYANASLGTSPTASMGAGSNGAGGPAALLASNLPGERQLEGQQAPAITIEKSAPAEIQVNRKATFQLRVRNNGNAPAHNVVVVDRVPQGTQFVDATPPTMPNADGTIVWQIAAVKPGEEVVLAMNLLPQVAGEIGSVAQATFQTRASVRTICTKPELKLDVTAVKQVLIGQPFSLEITITNIGNGAAEKVVIDEDVPEGFTHAAGRELEHEIGTLQPQESRRLTLVLDSAKAGTYQNHLTIRGEGDLYDEDVRPISVTTPQLQVTMQGPSLRYLDRQATYAVHLANAGTAAARNVEMVTYLPKGMKYVTSDNQGQYDTQSHAVYWSLEELPSDKQGDVRVTVLPIEPGNQKLKTDVRAELGLQEICEHEVVVEGLAELAFVISDVADPIEVGSETTYEIKVHNRGSKPDTEIQLIAELPAGVTPTSGDGPSQGTVQGQRVVFTALPQLGPNEEAVFKIHARGAAIGDHVIRAQLRSAELRVPVTKEESTRVYTDN